MNLIESIDITIWGRAFNLPVEYDCYEDESVTQEQIDSLNVFLQQSELLESSKDIVVDFSREALMSDELNQKKDNIFSYVKPECIFVKRSTKNPRVALMCKYRYDLEHGLAVVIGSDGNITVGIQDIIL